jgi:hypothetical protein
VDSFLLYPNFHFVIIFFSSHFQIPSKRKLILMWLTFLVNRFPVKYQHYVRQVEHSETSRCIEEDSSLRSD